MIDPQLPDDLERLERKLAERPREEPSPELRSRVTVDRPGRVARGSGDPRITRAGGGGRGRSPVDEPLAQRRELRPGPAAAGGGGAGVRRFLFAADSAAAAGDFCRGGPSRGRALSSEYRLDALPVAAVAADREAAPSRRNMIAKGRFMGYFLLWIESLALGLVFMATMLACLGRWRRLRARAEIAIVLALAMLVPYAALTVGLVCEVRDFGIASASIYPLAALTLLHGRGDWSG